ncbi:hypothetical protein [Nonomuraea harbinensis]|uniref:Uncharacterized protein n=1 Tax=Nonomuraea harbinensis TaxID=1286938 RepID=A0ABW1BV85_9ACTN|nr:hypothetical protein [Nonomuraea harbinensis]
MPKLKSVLAGLALSTAVTGGVVVAGATMTTTSAAAATQVSAGTSVLTGGHCGHRCWWRKHHRKHVRVIVENFNINRNPFEHRRHHRNWGWDDLD